MEREIILVVDDEASLREMVCQILSKHYEVVTALSGKQAVELAKKLKPKVILLDISMPDMTGVEVCSALRTDSTLNRTYFIMVTALNDSNQKTAAFLAGADDYLEKPFKPEELLARVSSKIRRVRESDTASALRSLGNLRLDFSKMCLWVKENEQIKLGVTELKIFNSLLNASGKVITRKQLVSEVWEPGSDRVVDPHITSLRKKLSTSNVEIKTLYGEGYSLIVTS